MVGWWGVTLIWLIGWLVDELVECCFIGLVGWLVDELVGWPVVWLGGWLLGRPAAASLLVGWLVHESRTLTMGLIASFKKLEMGVLTAILSLIHRAGHDWY